jgi:NAD(P)-dependent dehydrogenase (short-subunit alcohol dehydrogenase family)
MNGSAILNSFKNFEGRRIIVTGAASGLGKATAEELTLLGAEVYALDRSPADAGHKYVRVDLLDPRSIEAAVAEVGGPVHALFNAAGVGGSTGAFELVACNFIGTRYLTELVLPSMPDGSAIASISTTGGALWRGSLETLRPLLETKSFEEAAEWTRNWAREWEVKWQAATTGEALKPNASMLLNAYPFSKQALVLYTILKAKQLVPRRIRVNTISPHAVETPMWHSYADGRDEEHIERWARGLGGKLADARELAYPLIFLNSDLASHINGTDLFVDGGWAIKNLEYDGVDLPKI